jgi:arylsulfatase/arylsulfatase A
MNADQVARIFAMITNIDQNVGRLFERLEALGLTENTLVLFLVDNGPNTRRFVTGFRGMKTDVYEGGIRSPLLAHWPSRLTPGIASDRIAAHIDIAPTLLEAAGVAIPDELDIDGRSLLPLLQRDENGWPDRALFIQTHRGDAPARYHHFAARTQRWKLLNASGFTRDSLPGDPSFELYDMQNDPFELNNVAAQYPDTLQHLIASYDAWFDDVSSTRPDNYAPPRIAIDPTEENPTVLTRQDWRYPGTHGNDGWARDALGYWLIDVDQGGAYTIDWRFAPDNTPGIARLAVNGTPYEHPLEPKATQTRFESIELPPGPATIEAELIHAGKTRGIHQMDVLFE